MSRSPLSTPPAFAALFLCACAHPSARSDPSPTELEAFECPCVCPGEETAGGGAEIGFERQSSVCELRLDPRSRETLPNGCCLLTSTIEIRNSTGVDIEVKLFGCDLRKWPTSHEIARVRVGREPLVEILELFCPAPRADSAPEQRSQRMSMRGEPLREGAQGDPFVVECRDRAECLELAELIQGTRAWGGSYRSGSGPIAPNVLGAWSLNGMGTEVIARWATTEPFGSGAGPVDMSLVQDLPVSDWPKPVLALCVEVKLLPREEHPLPIESALGPRAP